jgi:3-oxoacyl-[acyl-carrier protein] reductase
MDLGLKDATAVVVGGGRGMGLAAARCLADDGARVAIVGRTKDVLEKAAKYLADRGSPDALAVFADTGDAAAVQQVFDEIGERWNGELNVLINAVGPGTRGTFDDLTDEQWREPFDDGVMGMVLLLAPDEILVNVVSPVSIASEALLGWAQSVGVDGGSDFT